MADPFCAELRKDYTELPPELSSGDPTNIFYQFVDAKGKGAAYTGVQFGNLKVKERIIDSRGTSSFLLFMAMHIEPKSQNRFEFSMISAEVDALIEILPRNMFGKLADFADLYEAFKATATYGPNWRTEADAFASANIERSNGQMGPDGKLRGGHWASSFKGIRAKTMRHEVDHVHFAVEECRAVVDDFLRQAKALGRAPDRVRLPAERVQELMKVPMGRFGFPHFDVGAMEHQKIAKRDVFFMVAWYELYELKMPILSNAGLEALLRAQTDRLLAEGMRQLGEAYPWL